MLTFVYWNYTWIFFEAMCFLQCHQGKVFFGGTFVTGRCGVLLFLSLLSSFRRRRMSPMILSMLATCLWALRGAFELPRINTTEQLSASIMIYCRNDQYSCRPSNILCHNGRRSSSVWQKTQIFMLGKYSDILSAGDTE